MVVVMTQMMMMILMKRKKPDQAGDDGWSFETVKPQKTGPVKASEPPAAVSTPTPKDTKNSNGSNTKPSVVSPPQDSKNSKDKKGSTSKASSKPEEDIKAKPAEVKPAEVKQPEIKPASTAVTNANAGRPSALTSVIYPVLSKLLKTYQDEATISALAQLKIAFDNAERAQPGLTHTMIAQIIETLKR